MKKQTRKKLLIGLLICVALICFTYVQNNWIEINEWSLAQEELPLGFHGYKIVHLSDLHNKTFGPKQEVLVKKVAQTNPE